MANTIKIGFLFPYSSIHPEMSRDVMDGFFASLSEVYRNQFQFYPEFINTGNVESVKAALNKLIMFHNVDIMSGFVSYKMLPDIILHTSGKGKLCFFFDMGEYLPPLQTLPETLFFNSFQFWQLEYALGNWAQKRFRGKGAMLMSVYDAGYHIHSAFWQGAVYAGAEEIDMHVIPYNTEMKSIKPVLPHFFDKIEKSGVEYLHALFCGNEALEFFDGYKQSGLFKKIPLLVSPHMASDAVLSKIKNLGLEFYSASGWNYKQPTEVNQQFKQRMETFSGRKASLFALMGYEMGLAFLPILPQLQRGDIETAIRFLKTHHIESPRGKRNFWIDNKEEKPYIEIEKISLQGLEYSHLIVEQGDAMAYNHAVFEDIHNLCVSGWRNPYLCV
jgi:branched-chain amino acid transport system substrate-binding protein